MMKTAAKHLTTFWRVWLLIVIAFPAMVGGKSKDVPEGWANIDWAHLPTVKDYPQTGGVYIQVDYSIGGKIGYYSERFHEVYRVLDDRGLEGAKVEVLPRVMSFQARLLRDGKPVREVHPDQEGKVSGNEFKDAQVGDVIENFQERRLPPLVIINTTFLVSRPHPIMNCVLRFREYSGFELLTAGHRVYHTQQDFHSIPGSPWLELVLANLPPVPREPFTRPFEEEGIWIHLCAPQISVATGNYFADYVGASQGLMGYVSRWEYLPVAPNFFIPHSNETSFGFNREQKNKLLVGDPNRIALEDLKSFYYRSMAESLARKMPGRSDLELWKEILVAKGFPVEIGMVRTRDRGPIDRSLPSTTQFNRKILKVRSNDQDLWLDPSYVGCPFGQLPWFEQGAGVFFPINTTKERMKGVMRTSQNESKECTVCPTTIPFLKNELNSISRELRVRRTAAGLELNFKATLDGQAAMKVRHELLTLAADKKDFEDYFKQELQVLLPNEYLPSLRWRAENLEDFEQPLVLSSSFTVALDSGHPLAIPQNPFPPLHYAFPSGPRLRDIQFPYLEKELSRLTIETASGLSVSFPASHPVAVDTQFAFGSGKITPEEAGLTFETMINEKAAAIPAAQYGEVLSFQTTIKNWNENKVTVAAKP